MFRILRQNVENLENLCIPCKNHEILEIYRIPRHNYENHKKTNIPVQNHEKS